MFICLTLYRKEQNESFSSHTPISFFKETNKGKHKKKLKKKSNKKNTKSKKKIQNTKIKPSKYKQRKLNK